MWGAMNNNSGLEATGCKQCEISPLGWNQTPSSLLWNFDTAQRNVFWAARGLQYWERVLPVLTSKHPASGIISKHFQSRVSYKCILYVLICKVGHWRMHLFSSRDDLNYVVWREEFELKNKAFTMRYPTKQESQTMIQRYLGQDACKPPQILMTSL